MKASDLRIGNMVDCLIIDEEKRFYQPHVLDIQDITWINDNPKDEEEFKPIPLTEDWLIDLGFNKEYIDNHIGIDIPGTDFVLASPETSYNSTGKYTWFFRQGNVPMFKPIDYVHEFQNLFHSLTGTELELKSSS